MNDQKADQGKHEASSNMFMDASSNPWASQASKRSWKSGIAFIAVLAIAGAATLWGLHKKEVSDATAERTASEGIPPTLEGIRLRLTQCQRNGDRPCQERLWVALVNQMPNDGKARANLGMVMNARSEYPQAAEQMHQAIEMGEGGYDLFGTYADALTHLGRVDEAIDWSYKSLSVLPRLVDVRSNLAKLLVSQHRPYEALALLEGFDRIAPQYGKTDYFGAQRISIESTLTDAGAGSGGATPETTALRLPVFEKHFFAPVVLGHARPTAFMIDTGATVVTLDTAVLDAAAPVVQQESRTAVATLADGRRVIVHPFRIETLRVGPYLLHDVEAIACPGCQALLGQSALSHFDLQSSRREGVEFLTMTPRGK